MFIDPLGATLYASSNPMHGISKHQGLKQFEWDANPPTAHKESDDVDSLARGQSQHTTMHATIAKKTKSKRRSFIRAEWAKTKPWEPY